MRYPSAGVGCVLFLLSVARFHAPDTGFSILTTIGSKPDSQIVPALARLPHYLSDEFYGLDGAYYVQIALHPLLDEPAGSFHRQSALPGETHHGIEGDVSGWTGPSSLDCSSVCLAKRGPLTGTGLPAAALAAVERPPSRAAVGRGAFFQSLACNLLLRNPYGTDQFSPRVCFASEGGMEGRVSQKDCSVAVVMEDNSFNRNKACSGFIISS